MPMPLLLFSKLKQYKDTRDLGSGNHKDTIRGHKNKFDICINMLNSCSYHWSLDHMSLAHLNTEARISGKAYGGWLTNSTSP